MPKSVMSELPVAAPGRVQPWGSRPETQLLLALAVLAFFPLLFELGRNPVQLWDESRVAINSVNMALHGRWLVPYYGNDPDHWNTKPPLLIWLQALSFKAFGFSAWALRLPTALASVATAYLVFRFAARVLQRPLAGFFGALVLVTCAGFVKLHVARTGDYDALLTLWETIVWICFFLYLETGRARYLYWVAGALTAAMLTKSIAGLLGLPGLLLYAVVQRKTWWLLRQPRVYAAAGAAAAVIIGYYVAREAADPGYWKAVQYNDLGGRFLENQGDGDMWWYYLQNLQRYTFTHWLWAIGPAILLSFSRTTGVERRAALLLVLFVSGWLAVVSASVSRHDWYDAPMYPALALLVGLGLAIFYQDLLGLYLPRLRRWQGWALQLALVLGVFYVPYEAIIDQLIQERHSDYHMGPDGYLGRYLPTAVQTQPQVNDMTVLYEGNYNAVLTYYQLVYQTQGKNVVARAGHTARSLEPGTVVVVCNPTYRASLDSTFRLVQLHEDLPCQTVLLLPRTH
ncbi:MAG: ArnT family glycosyltransferase [Janthinobacterium lividum]